MTAHNLPLVLVSAWNDSGGGFTHRLFDGHPDVNCWPFELQLGTSEVSDGFADWFHKKYRWPVFSKSLTNASTEELFTSILDLETKENLTFRGKDKFKDFRLNFDINDWREQFSTLLQYAPSRTRADVIYAYIAALFKVWKGIHPSEFWVLPCIGHCPDVILDADMIFADFPAAKIIHVYRNPFAGFYDLRVRRPEITVETYCKKWSLVNHTAFYFAQKYPEKVKLISYAELLSDREHVMRESAEWLGIEFVNQLMTPTWDGRALDQIQPFGGVQSTVPNYDMTVREKLDQADHGEIEQRTSYVASLLNVR